MNLYFFQLLQDSTRHQRVSMVAYCSQMFNLNRLETPTPISTFVARSQIVILSCLCVCLAAFLAGYGSLCDGHDTSCYMHVVLSLSCLIGK